MPVESRIELSGKENSLHPLLKNFLENPDSLSEDMLRQLVEYSRFETFLPDTTICYGMNIIQFICYFGHLRSLQYLSEIMKELFQEMIAANDYRAFGWASNNGHLPVVQFLAEMVAGEKRQEMIVADYYRAFRWASDNGHLPVVKFLADTVAAEKCQEMIAEDGYYAFRYASKKGHLPVVQFLAETVTAEKCQEMIAEDGYYAFRYASKKGYLPVVQFLVETVAAKKSQEMIAEDGYYAFRYASKNGHYAVCEFLLQKDRKQLAVPTREIKNALIEGMSNNRHVSALTHHIIGMLYEPWRVTWIMSMAGFSPFFIPTKTIINPFCFSQYLTGKEQNRIENKDSRLPPESVEMAKCRLRLFSTDLGCVSQSGDEGKKNEAALRVTEELEKAVVIEDRTVPGYSALVKNALFVNKIREEFRPKDSDKQSQPVSCIGK